MTACGGNGEPCCLDPRPDPNDCYKSHDFQIRCQENSDCCSDACVKYDESGGMCIDVKHPVTKKPHCGDSSLYCEEGTCHACGLLGNACCADPKKLCNSEAGDAPLECSEGKCLISSALQCPDGTQVGDGTSCASGAAFKTATGDNECCITPAQAKESKMCSYHDTVTGNIVLFPGGSYCLKPPTDETMRTSGVCDSGNCVECGDPGERCCTLQGDPPRPGDSIRAGSLTCGAGLQCVSNIKLPDNCKLNGTDCDQDSECCTGACAPDPESEDTGASICVPDDTDPSEAVCPTLSDCKCETCGDAAGKPCCAGPYYPDPTTGDMKKAYYCGKGYTCTDAYGASPEFRRCVPHNDPDDTHWAHARDMCLSFTVDRAATAAWANDTGKDPPDKWKASSAVVNWTHACVTCAEGGGGIFSPAFLSGNMFTPSAVACMIYATPVKVLGVGGGSKIVRALFRPE